MKTAALVTLATLCCLALTELGFGLVNALWPPAGDQLRHYSINIGKHAHLSDEERQELRSQALRTTMGRLPFLKPENTPSEKMHDRAAVDRSRQLPPGSLNYRNFRLRPELAYRSVETVHGTNEVVFDANFTTDAAGRRTTVNPDPEARKDFLALFGCSFTFGMGVEDSQTLASRIAAAAPRTMVYNYGVPGGSPSLALIQLEAQGFRETIPQAHGQAVFVVIRDQLERLFPSTYNDYLNYDRPYHERDSDGRVVRRERFHLAHPWKAALYWWLRRDPLLRFFNVDFPFRFDDDDVRFWAELLQQFDVEWRQMFPGSSFTVVIWPGMGDLEPVLTEYLDVLHVPYLDYGSQPLEKLVKGRATLSPYDWHPSPEAHALVGAQLARDLGLSDSGVRSKP